MFYFTHLKIYRNRILLEKMMSLFLFSLINVIGTFVLLSEHRSLELTTAATPACGQANLGLQVLLWGTPNTGSFHGFSVEKYFGQGRSPSAGTEEVVQVVDWLLEDLGSPVTSPRRGEC